MKRKEVMNEGTLISTNQQESIRSSSAPRDSLTKLPDTEFEVMFQLVNAFSGSKKLSKEEINELSSWLKNQEEE